MNVVIVMMCPQFQPTRKRVKTAKSSGFHPGFDFGHYVQDIWKEKLEAVPLKSKTVSKKGKMTAPTSLDAKIKKVKSTLRNGGVDNGLDESVVEIKEEDSDSDEDDDESEDSDVLESDNSMSGQKINKSKKRLKKKPSEINEDDDIDLSDDELKQDQVVLKGILSKKKKRNKKGEVDDESGDEEKEAVARLEDDPNFSFETNMSFQQMNLSRPLLKAITSLGFIHPTPIQAAAIPMALAGRDICGCAATGTGKTAAYMLPVLERLLYKVWMGIVLSSNSQAFISKTHLYIFYHCANICLF